LSKKGESKNQKNEMTAYKKCSLKTNLNKAIKASKNIEALHNLIRLNETIKQKSRHLFVA